MLGSDAQLWVCREWKSRAGLVQRRSPNSPKRRPQLTLNYAFFHDPLPTRRYYLRHLVSRQWLRAPLLTERLGLLAPPSLSPHPTHHRNGCRCTADFGDGRAVAAITLQAAPPTSGTSGSSGSRGGKVGRGGSDGSGGRGWCSDELDGATVTVRVDSGGRSSADVVTTAAAQDPTTLAIADGSSVAADPSSSDWWLCDCGDNSDAAQAAQQGSAALSGRRGACQTNDAGNASRFKAFCSTQFTLSGSQRWRWHASMSFADHSETTTSDPPK